MKKKDSYEETHHKKYKLNTKDLDIPMMYEEVLMVKNMNLPDEEKEHLDNKMIIELQ